MSSEIANLEIKQYVGPYNERPDAGVEGRVYEVRDPDHDKHGAVYYDDGDSWELVDRQFGSVHAVEINNTVHIFETATDLHDAVVEHGSHTRYVVHDKGSPYVFESGDLLLPSEVVSNIEIVGEGYPTFKLGDGVEDDLIRSANDGSGSTTTNVRIEGILFDGNRANNSTGGPKDPDGDGNTEFKGNSAIRAINCSDWVIEDCDFSDWERYGYCGTLTQGPMVIRDCTADNSGDDGYTVTNQYFQVKDPDSAYHIFENCEGTNCDDQGIEIEDGAQNVIVRDSTLSGNGNSGGVVKSHIQNNLVDNHEEPANNTKWVNVRFVNNTAAGIRMKGSALGVSKNHTFIGCTFEGNSGLGFSVGSDPTERQGFDTVTLSDCIFENNSLRTFGANLIRNLTFDVSVKNGGISVKEPPISDVTINAHVDGGSITLTGGSTDVRDLTITDDTHVEGAQGAGLQIEGRGAVFENVVVEGTYKNNGQDTTLDDDERVGVDVRPYGGSPADFHILFKGVEAYDNQSTKTQQYGVNPNGSFLRFDNCEFSGNAQGDYTMPELAGASIRDGRGFYAGDPSTSGNPWFANTDWAYKHNVLIEDTANNNFYRVDHTESFVGPL